METKDKYLADYLFSTPNFWIGAGSVLNIAGNYYQFNSSSGEKEADNLAIECDFGIVGQDIQNALASETHLLTLSKPK